jgi:hypothetical protein
MRERIVVNMVWTGANIDTKIGPLLPRHHVCREKFNAEFITPCKQPNLIRSNLTQTVLSMEVQLTA